MPFDLTVLVLAAPACVPVLAGVPPHDDDRLVATVPEGHEPTGPEVFPGAASRDVPLPFAFSHGGDHVTFFAHASGRTHAFVAGDPVDRGDRFLGPVVSADGQHVALAVGRVAKNRTTAWTVYVDGSPVAKKEAWLGGLVLAPDGNALAYWSRPGFRPNQDGFDDSARAELVLWSRTSEKKRFKARRSEGYAFAETQHAPVLADGGRRVLGRANVDGFRSIVRAGGRRDEVAWSDRGGYQDVAFSPDGERLALVLFDPTDAVAGASWRPLSIDVDGKPLKSAGDAAGRPVFSADGEHVAYVFHEGGHFGVGSGKVTLTLGEDPVTRVAIDTSGAHVAWIAHRGGELDPSAWLSAAGHLLVRGGRTCVGHGTLGDPDTVALGPAVDQVRELVLSPTGEHVAYIAGTSVHVGEASAGPFDAVDRVLWIDDDTVAFGTREGREYWWRHLDVP